jgi:hypothetical protein
MKHEAISHDNAMPASVSAPCSVAPLAVGASCVALVRASQWYSDTGLKVAPGQAYCLRVPPHQSWFDAGRVNVAPQGEPGSGIMNVYSSRKRAPEAGWFALIAAVVRHDPEPMSVASEQLDSVDVSGLERPCGPGGDGRRWEPPVAGAMAFYPNDAIADSYDKAFFYRNNSGQIWVVITRLPDRTS